MIVTFCNMSTVVKKKQKSDPIVFNDVAILELKRQGFEPFSL